jgi:hypothetical protein
LCGGSAEATIIAVSEAFTDGAALVLGLLLVVSGALKLARPRGFGNAVARLLPKGPDLRGRRIAILLAGPVVGSVELALGAGLLLSAQLPTGPAKAVALAVAGLYLSFVVVVVVAVRKGTACGCFDSFSDSAAGPAELARSISLALLAVWVAAETLADGAVDPLRIGAAVAAVPLLAAVAALFIAAAALSPDQPPGRTATTAVWSLVGRVTSRFEDITPGSADELSPDGSQEAVDAARSTASARAFEAWLGPRAAEIDWAGASATRISSTVLGRPVWGIVVRPPSTGDLSVMVSLPWDASLAPDAVVIASVGGRPVSVVNGVVEVAGVPATPA